MQGGENGSTGARSFRGQSERLVRECCKGNQAAWAALIEKYKNLIFSVPIKFGLSREDAADIFQAVCLDLLTDLQRLREPQALPKWLMQNAYHKCLRTKKQRFDVFDDPAELEQQPEGQSRGTSRRDALPVATGTNAAGRDRCASCPVQSIDRTAFF